MQRAQKTVVETLLPLNVVLEFLAFRQALVDAQNLLLDIQAAYYKASAAADAGVAKLERAIGAPITNPTNSSTKSNSNNGRRNK